VVGGPPPFFFFFFSPANGRHLYKVGVKLFFKISANVTVFNSCPSIIHVFQ